MEFFGVSGHKMICSKGDFSAIYDTHQINGQLISTMKYSCRPTRGSEIFIKKIPRDALLQDILELVIHCGDVYQIRLLMDFSGFNRGYCFVTFFYRNSARQSVVTLNGSRIKSSNVIVKLSFDNNKLEMRGIPFGIHRDEIFRVMEGIGDGLQKVITFKNYPNGRDVCVLKYDTHRHALEARKRVWPRVNLWQRLIEIDWAVPREVLNSKRLYFRNVPRDTSKTQLYNEVVGYVKPETLLNMFLCDGLGYFLFTSYFAAKSAMVCLSSVQICGKLLQFSFHRFVSRLHAPIKK